MNKDELNLESSKSLNRPAWIQYDLCAYENKYVVRRGKFTILEDYYVKSSGLDR